MFLHDYFLACEISTVRTQTLRHNHFLYYMKYHTSKYNKLKQISKSTSSAKVIILKQFDIDP